MESTSILFLDNDGVIVLQDEGAEAVDDFGPAFDPVMVGYIADIQRQTGCMIVSSSSWRYRAEGGLPAMQRMVKERPLPFIINDTLPLQQNGQRDRTGELIRQYMRNFPDGTKYCILDDAQPDFFHANQLPYLVQTNFRRGMTELDSQQVLDRLLPHKNIDIKTQSL